MAMGRKRKGKGPRGEVIVMFPSTVMGYLEAAARRRAMAADELVMEIVGGVLTRGSIDKALEGWADYRCGYQSSGGEIPEREGRQ